MAKDDDWYWKCEPSLVLADEDLALCPAPEGWLDEGLSCVGLYFLMLCVMHRSPRRGYLLSSNGLPLSTADLARLVRRPVDVVNKVQQVILTRKLFSVSTKGEIYSRGMVKRAELRKKRQIAGAKGGVGNRVVRTHEPGFVYAMQRNRDKAVKVGSSNEPKRRLYQVNAQQDGGVVLLAYWEVCDMKLFEGMAHQYLAEHRIDGEWFAISENDLVNLGEFLTKQNIKQNVQQTLAITSELKTDNDSGQNPHESLGVAWCFHSKRRRGRGPADDPVDAEEFLVELERELGWTRSRMLEEICRKGRGKTETLGEFKFRLKKNPDEAAQAKPLTAAEMIDQMQEQRRKMGIA